MKNYFLLLLLSNINKVASLSPNIVNSGKPVCTNCKFYKPNKFSNFDSDVGECLFHGRKNIYNGKITYEYADLCRENTEKCGLEGVNFEEETNLAMKKSIHHVRQYSYIYTTIPFFVLYIYIVICGQK